MKLNIAYFYPEKLNLYGDNGNVEILAKRAKDRDIHVNVTKVGVGTTLNQQFMYDVDLIFMGGGPDANQIDVHKDLIEKAAYLSDYINNGGVGLFICGSYQLLGNYYKSSNGTVVKGLEIFDLYTEHFGNKKPRCIGNVVCNLNKSILDDEIFNNVNNIGDTLVGFENHGGRTYLNPGTIAFCSVILGHGNNSEDGSEGVHYKNSFGTYLHGPILSKNPHFADFLLAKSLKVKELKPLDDELILLAHTASKELKQ